MAEELFVEVGEVIRAKEEALIAHQLIQHLYGKLGCASAGISEQRVIDRIKQEITNLLQDGGKATSYCQGGTIIGLLID
jgi:hypothetical protein